MEENNYTVTTKQFKCKSEAMLDVTLDDEKISIPVSELLNCQIGYSYNISSNDNSNRKILTLTNKALYGCELSLIYYEINTLKSITIIKITIESSSIVI